MEREQLLAQAQVELDVWLEKFRPLLEEARQHGYAGAVVLTCYDPLSDYDLSNWASVGSGNQVYGALSAWLRCWEG